MKKIPRARNESGRACPGQVPKLKSEELNHRKSVPRLYGKERDRPNRIHRRDAKRAEREFNTLRPLCDISAPAAVNKFDKNLPRDFKFEPPLRETSPWLFPLSLFHLAEEPNRWYKGSA